MSTATGELQAKVDGAQNSIGKWTTMLAGIDLVKNAIEGLNQVTETFSASGIRLDSQMHDLSAVAGVTGETLKQIEGFARDSAKAFTAKKTSFYWTLNRYLCLPLISALTLFMSRKD